MSDSMQRPVDDAELAQRLVDQAKAEGVSLTGPGGLLGGLTKRVLETALGAAISARIEAVRAEEKRHDRDTATRSAGRTAPAHGRRRRP